MPVPLTGLHPGRETDDARLRALREGRLTCGPETLQVNLGNRCNARCVFCWNHSPLVEPPPASWHAQRLSGEHMGNVIGSLPALRPGRVVLSGRGEPLLHPAAVDLLAALRDESIPAAIQTNGRAGPEPAEIVDLGVDHLVVNVSAGTRSGYERTHPGEGRLFRTMVRRIERIAALAAPGGRPRITIVAVIQASNLEELARIVELTASMGAGGVELKGMEMARGLEPLALGRRDARRVLAALPALRERARELDLAMHDAHLVKLLGSGSRSFTAPLEHGPCYMGWYYLRVTCDGRVMFCCKDKPMGHLDERSLYRTWRSPAYHLGRLAARDGDASSGLMGGKCRTCSNFERNEQVAGRLASIPPGASRPG